VTTGIPAYVPKSLVHDYDYCDMGSNTDLCEIVQSYFTPKKIIGLEKVATDLTVSLIDGCYADGEQIQAQLGKANRMTYLPLTWTVS
jgi:hypothetical protein